MASSAAGKILVEGVAGTPNGPDGIAFAGFVHGFAETADMNIHGPLVDFRIHAPNAIEQLAAGKHATGPLHQEFEEFKFGWSEMQLAIAPANAMAATIQHQIAQFKRRRQAIG